MKPCVTGLRRLAAASALAIAIFIAQAPSAQALLLGAGQTATIDFDFGTAGGAPQPLIFSFEITTSGDVFDDPSGTFGFEFLDIGVPGVIFVGYDATGGVASLGVISVSISTTDLAGSLRFGTLGESINIVDVSLIEILDDVGGQLVGPTPLTLPENADVVLPEPAALAAFGLGLIGIGALHRRRRDRFPV